MQVQGQGGRGLSVLPAQFCCGPKTALKNKVNSLKKYLEDTHSLRGSRVEGNLDIFLHRVLYCLIFTSTM